MSVAARSWSGRSESWSRVLSQPPDIGVLVVVDRVLRWERAALACEGIVAIGSGKSSAAAVVESTRRSLVPRRVPIRDRAACRWDPA